MAGYLEGPWTVSNETTDERQRARALATYDVIGPRAAQNTS